MSAKHENVEALFDEALKFQPEERPGFVANACADNSGLRSRLEELLRAAENAGDFLPESPNDPTVGASPVTEQPGDSIGRYKLLEKIGEGGCGIVFMAEQEEPVRRRVALKVIKPGMDTKSVIARFEAERQALAMMDHPHIAKVHDGGVTDTGRPYFVMELVRGIRITDYCQEHRLDVRERLDLFTAVCSAVQHAHQKGIIHRDLKPSNILVSELDGRPVPKVIDFGIAKATEQKLTDKTLFTQFAQFVGTPAYMSPEQAAMTIADIDTRSDIYSLGVLLYELLTGSTPFDAKELLNAGFDEMRRIIRETEPQKPSTRLTQSEGRGQKTEGSGQASEAGGLKSALHIPHSALPTDLDWIVMKCLEKDRARRYETASSLAADIERHLSSEPVTARPASAAYRFRKMVRRNKVAVTAAAAVLAALITGLGGSTWMFFSEKHAREKGKQALERAVAAEQEQSRLRQAAEAAEMAQREERTKAESEAARSEQIAGFLEEMLKGVGPSVALGRDTTLLREILDKTEEQVGNDLKNQPEVEASLREILGRVYFALGNFEKSEAMHRAGLERLRALYQGDHPKIAFSLRSLANVLCAEFKLDEAGSIYREVLAMQKKLLGDEDAEVASTLTNYALVLHEQRKLPEAEAMFREALALHRKLWSDDHQHVTATLNNLALVLEDLGKPVEAEAAHREVLATRRKLYPGDHPDTATTLRNLAGVLNTQGKRDEAVATYREALAVMRKVYPDGHPHMAAVLGSLGKLLSNLGRNGEAEPLVREALDLITQSRNDLHPDLTDAIGNLALILGRQKKFAEAQTLCREAMEKARALKDQPGRVASSIAGLADVLEMQGKFADSEPLRREVLEITRQLPHPHTGWVERRLSELDENLYRQGKFADAEPLARDVLKLTTARLGADHSQALSALSRIARLLSDWAWTGHRSKSEIGNQKSEIAGHAREAEQLMRDCLATWLRGDGAKADDGARMTAEFRSRLGGALVGAATTDTSLTPQAALAKFTEAESLLLAANETMQKNQALESKFRRDSLTRLVRLYEVWNKPDKASEWRRKLAEFDKADAAPDGKPKAESSKH